VHDPKDLLGPLGQAVWSGVDELKRSGRVAKIGVSVYEPDEVDRILDLYPVDIIQLPLNALDRRLVEGGQLERLATAGVEVHARSIFLQGLLLAPIHEIPAKFEPIRSALQELDRQLAQYRLSRLEGLLAAAFAHPEISRFVVGVTSCAELDTILCATDHADATDSLEIQLPRIDPLHLNPSRWRELE
jgi:aryl-alcohol dehydrogenase-like predicted oxidoreductase